MQLSNKKKKINHMLLIIMLLLVGCGSKKEELKPETDYENDDYSYIAEYEFFSIDDMPISAVFGEDGTLFFSTYKQNIGSNLFYLPPGVNKPVEIPLESKDNKWITSKGKDKKGNLLFSHGLYQDGLLKELELVKVNVNGILLEIVDVTEFFTEMEGFEAKYLLGDEEGNFYIGNGKSVYVIDSGGEFLYELISEKNIIDMFFTKDGDMMMAHVGELEEIIPEKKALKPVASDISFKNGIYETGREKELLFSSGNTLYTCNIKDGELTEVLNWMNNDIDSIALRSFMTLEDGRIVAFTSNGTGGRTECELIFLTRKKRSEVPKKTILTYGCAFINTITNSQILRFNKMSQEYRVEIKQYGDESMDFESRKMLLQTDIISGKGPDILDIGVFFSESERNELIEMGILEDLNPYFEKDENMQREEYIESVLHVYEKDNRLYAIMPSFGIEFLAGRTADIGEQSSWTIEEMMEFMDNQPDEKRILPRTGQREMLDIFLRLNIQEFVDWENGACYFDGIEFRQLLEFVSRFSKEGDKEFYYYENVEQIRNGEIPLLEAGALSAQDLQMTEFLFGESINAIGYPTDTGKGVIAHPCISVLSISSNSKEKEGAWRFIRYLLEEEQQFEMGIIGASGFPIHKSALDQIFEKLMEKEYEKDEEGNIKEKSKISWSVGTAEMEEEEPILRIHLYAATEEEVKRMRELLDSIGNSIDTSMDRKMFEIIIEEAEAFFEGQKSLDEVVNIIQSRAQIYVNE